MRLPPSRSGDSYDSVTLSSVMLTTSRSAGLEGLAAEEENVICGMVYDRNEFGLGVIEMTYNLIVVNGRSIVMDRLINCYISTFSQFCISIIQ